MSTAPVSTGGRHALPPHTVHTAVLSRRWRDHGDARARDALLERYMPLARKLALRYLSAHEPLDDLRQVAALGLLGAIDRFDPDRGVPFAAYAVPTIVGELKRYFRNTGWSVHVPRGAQEMALRVERAAREIRAEQGHQPRVGELAEYLEVEPEDVLRGLEANTAHHSISLDAAARSGDDEDLSPLAERLGSSEEGYGRVEVSLSLAATIGHLPTLERRALGLRLQRDMRQVDIARELGCSQMQVSRLLRRAVTRLRELTDPDLTVATRAR